MPKDVYPSAMINSKKSSEVESRIDLEGIAESFNNYSEELQAVSSDSYSDDYASRFGCILLFALFWDFLWDYCSILVITVVSLFIS